MEAREMTQKELAEKIRRPQQTISLIINGRKGISEETAVDLEQAFDGELSAEFWLNLDSNYRLHRERQKRQERKAG
ncbi:MAG: HigA family addiction module antitoxin [Armatimonadota bacterium]